MKIVAIIQARTGSQRLPGKVLKEILPRKTALELMLERVVTIPSINQIVVASSSDPQDKPVLELAAGMGCTVFAGSEDDVLDRYYQAAKREKADIIVRLTADCPLLDPEVSNMTIQQLIQNLNNYDYATNGYPPTWPDGLDTEAFTFDLLEKLWHICKDPSQREHVTSLVWKHPSGLYAMGAPEGWSVRRTNYVADQDYSGYRWTLDEYEDLEFIRQIYRALYRGAKNIFSWREILSFIKEHPETGKINSMYRRNEGYLHPLIDRIEVPVRRPKLDISKKWWQQAKTLIPCGTQTLSKGPTQFVQGVAPIYLQRGDGCRVWDVDDNEYIDLAMALGPILLGYNEPIVNQAVVNQIKEGSCFSLMHPLEVEVAQLLTETIPYAEMARFGKHGSDVTAGAVRLARAYTGRERVAHCGYHGWQDWYIGHLNPRGIPNAVIGLQHSFNFNDIDSLHRLLKRYPGQFAAVIMEAQSLKPPRDNFLEKVRELTHQQGVVLIFDEICNGYRVAMGGAGELYNVYPDLGCFGKGMANGYPISALVGKACVMQKLEEVFFSFTFGGDAVSLAAAKATIEFIRQNGVLAHLKDMGSKLVSHTNLMIKRYGLEGVVEAIGPPSRSNLKFYSAFGFDELTIKSLFQQECIKRGILFTGAQTICYAHNLDDIAYILKVYDEALAILKDGLTKGTVDKKLEGEQVKPIFRPRS